MPGSNSGSNRTADVVIIGGGVIGLSIARELALRGERDVLLVDRGEFGAEASWAAGGILAPQVESESDDQFFRLACASRDLYPAFAAALKEESGLDVELERTGTIYVAFAEDEVEKLRSIFDWQQTRGLRVEWLAAADARNLEPKLSPHMRSALRFPNDWQVENRKLVQALIKSDRKLGTSLIAYCQATSVETKNHRVTGVQTSHGFIQAPAIVVAAGAWTSGIVPVRGQLLCFNPAEPIARHVIYSSRGYLVPRRDGRLLAGSTSERAGFDKRVTNEGVESIKSLAFDMAPGLKSVPITDSWAGFRPRAPDDLPLLGSDPNVDGLFYATGHYRNGILLAPITARMIAERILKGVDCSWLETFTP